MFNFNLSSVTISSYTFKYGNAYVNAIKDWCLGKKLSEIVINHRVAEGTLVKTIMRLEEFCKEMKNICNFINDLELLEKIEKCSNLLKRDIINCTSLYFDE
ncbi:Antiviral helicase ski2 [Conglomerata obtusa]